MTGASMAGASMTGPTPSAALVIGASALAYGSAIWGARRFFRVEDRGARSGQRLITALAGIAMLVAWWTLAGSDPGPAQTGAASGLFLASTALFWMAVRSCRSRALAFAFSSGPPGRPLTRGPFAWVRHPFYTSYLLGWLAPVAACPGSTTLVVLVAMTAVYWLAARREEAIFDLGPWADEYRAYRRRTGMFLPRLAGSTRTGTRNGA